MEQHLCPNPWWYTTGSTSLSEPSVQDAGSALLCNTWQCVNGARSHACRATGMLSTQDGSDRAWIAEAEMTFKRREANMPVAAELHDNPHQS